MSSSFSSEDERERQAREAYAALRADSLKAVISEATRQELLKVLIATKHLIWIGRALRMLPNLPDDTFEAMIDIIAESRDVGSASRVLRFVKVTEQRVAVLAPIVITSQDSFWADLTLQSINPLTDDHRYGLVEIIIKKNDPQLASLTLRRRKVPSAAQRERLRVVAGV